MQTIYLDNNATTCLDPFVKKVLIEALDLYGNPSSIHAFGQEARNQLTKARRFIASQLGVKPSELIFTSGGTEGANMLIRGLFYPNLQGHIITSSVEHSAVYSTVQFLESKGLRVTWLSSGAYGAATPQQVQEAITPETRLIALMAVNNETGVKTDIQGIAEIAEKAQIPFFVDGVAWVGKDSIQIPSGVTAFSFSGHKFHAPKGIGGLCVKQSLKWEPLLTGGPQESSKRAGTENLLGIIGLAEAFRQIQPESFLRLELLRNRLEEGLKSQLEGVFVNGLGPRIGNTTNLSFSDVEGESLVMNLDLAGISVSHGSACSSGSLEPSRILVKMGLPIERARSSIRFSLSRFTTEAEVDRTIAMVVAVVNQLRAL